MSDVLIISYCNLHLLIISCCTDPSRTSCCSAV